MKYRMCWLLALGFAFSVPVVAAQDTGVQLLEECRLAEDLPSSATYQDIVKATHCAGYLSGVIGMLGLWETVSPDVQEHSPAPVCFPEHGVTVLEAAKVVVKYLTNHPTLRHNPYDADVILALSDAYPCKSSDGR